MANTFRSAKGGKIIAWNDDAPGVEGTTGAHSKGVIYYNERTDTGRIIMGNYWEIFRILKGFLKKDSFIFWV